ncbi:hypothetical protein, partial [Pseudomonas aeruginosa]|uniref:hypothetical protein n=1 Tax=Pseudomonas aeruginosa TaxID=287 RepID=UPI0019690B99
PVVSEPNAHDAAFRNAINGKSKAMMFDLSRSPLKGESQSMFSGAYNSRKSRDDTMKPRRCDIMSSSRISRFSAR